MTSKTCSKAYHPVGRFFSITLKRQTGITLLVTAFLLLICPGILLRFATDSYSGSYDLDGELAIWAMLIFLASLLLGVILLCFNHSHLFSRKSADMYYSLPVKRDTMLAVRFGASIVGAVFAMTASFSGLTAVNFMSYVDGVAFWQMLKLYALCLLFLLLCMSVVLIFLVNSGSIFNFIFSFLVVCVGIPIVCLIGQYWYEDVAYGVSNSAAWLQYSSPFVYAIYQFIELEGSMREGKVLIEASPLILSAVGTLLFTAIAFLMHHHRKTEKAGGSFAYRAMPALITILASAMGGYLVGLIFNEWDGARELEFWLYFAIGASLVAMAAGAIISKGFRKIWKWLIYAGIATALMLSVLMVTHLLGERDRHYVPQEEDISSVTILGSYSTPELVLTSDFEMITELHEHLIAIESGEKERYGEYEEIVQPDGTKSQYYNDYFYSSLINSDFSIRYMLKNGKTVERSYWINDYEGLLMLFEIMQTDAYTEAWVECLEMQGAREVELYTHNRETAESDVALLTLQEAQELLRIYGKELHQAPEYTLWLEDRYYISVEFNAGNWIELNVPQSFVKTLAALEELMD